MQMLSELRTSKLSTHKYYELYIRAFDELRRLEMFFKDESRHVVSVVGLYELVQHAGNILPRLYLLCTVGSAYIRCKDAPVKDVLKDLVEMCIGVRHPRRGLFLWSYLSQVSRHEWPDIGSEYEGDSESMTDAVEFVVQNFTEMRTRLNEREEGKRTERAPVILKNLHVLSQIEDVDLEIFKDTVLPKVLVQVFPDEYHLQTLETLLAAFPQLQKPDQCRAVYACSHLFWVDDPEGIKDGERVLPCLKRALRIANAAQQMANVTRGCSGPVTVFVEVLNKYLYYFEKGNPQITSDTTQNLIELITTELQSDSLDAFFAGTLRYIQFQKQKGDLLGEKYDSFKVLILALC